MSSTTARLLAVAALTGAVSLPAGTTALAANRPPGQRVAPTTTDRHGPPPQRVFIGTAVQWVHEPDGSAREVTLH